MASIRVDQQTHAKLRRLSESEHKSIGQVVTEAVERYDKERFWEEARIAYERLRADPEAWREYQEETALWDTTSNDGLENEEPYYTPEELEEMLRDEEAGGS
ncbi:MAG TPA: hypothetical protein VM450_13885 [Thermomicrobiales bacterium]|nr:hypothetical protein [Thermomicrobiales bacterium]